MQNKEQAVNEIYKAIEEFGLVDTLHRVFGKNIRVRLELTKSICETPIEEMTLSVRAYNALKRAGIHTAGELADWITENKLHTIRNLGVKSVRELQTKLMCLGYEHLTQQEKKEVVRKLIENTEE